MIQQDFSHVIAGIMGAEFYRNNVRNSTLGATQVDPGLGQGTTGAGFIDLGDLANQYSGRTIKGLGVYISPIEVDRINRDARRYAGRDYGGRFP
jgi:hypothetical protein